MSSPSRLTTWCRLLRVPNLFTVPGDPLAGYLLATGGVLGWRVAGAIAASFLLYTAGLLLNDYFDREVDAKERPDRPIPSGAAQARTVLITGIALLLAGVVVARRVGGETAGVVAAALAGAVLAYDAVVKKLGLPGPVLMGGCRAGSVLLGAAFAGKVTSLPLLLVGGVTWVYVTSLTLVARREASGGRPGGTAYVPGAVLLAAGATMLWLSLTASWQKPEVVRSVSSHLKGEEAIWRTETIFVEDPRFDEAGPVAAGLLLLVGIEAALAAFRARRGLLHVSAFVGQVIRMLISVQAAWCVWSLRPRFGDALYVLLLWLVAGHFVVRWAAGLTARRFYGS